MKQFSLNEYLKNPSRKVVTRDGRPVRIICTDAKRAQKVIGLIEEGDKEIVYSYIPDGRFVDYRSSDIDLFFYTETKEGWLNLYRAEDGFMMLGYVHETKEKALNELKDKSNSFKHTDTIKIKWEE